MLLVFWTSAVCSGSASFPVEMGFPFKSTNKQQVVIPAGIQCKGGPLNLRTPPNGFRPGKPPAARRDRNCNLKPIPGQFTNGLGFGNAELAVWSRADQKEH